MHDTVEEVPECLNRRYQAIDDLVTDLSTCSDKSPCCDKLQAKPSNEAGVKLMCGFWNILKEDPDFNLKEAVQEKLCPKTVPNEMFGPSCHSVYMASVLQNCQARKDGKEEKKPKAGSCLGRMCRTPSVLVHTYVAGNEANDSLPLRKALTNVNQAVSLRNACSKNISNLMTAQTELQDEITRLEQREAEGNELLKKLDFMWTEMEKAYKKKLDDSATRQKTLLSQLKEIETSNDKWRKNKKEVEQQSCSIEKCHREMNERLADKIKDLTCIDMEIAALNDRLKNNKEEVKAVEKSMDSAKRASDQRIASLAAEIRKQQDRLKEEQRNKLAKDAEGRNYIKEARSELQKLSRALIETNIGKEDLLAQKESLALEVDLLKQSREVCNEKCKAKKLNMDEELKKIEQQIIAYKLKCTKFHQYTDTGDIQKFCPDCPLCADGGDTDFMCVCMAAKRRFLENIFENAYSVLASQVDTEPGKALGDLVIYNLKQSCDGKLGLEIRRELQKFIMQTVIKNFDLAVIAGAVKTRCEMDPDTYDQLIKCLMRVNVSRPITSDKETAAKKESCQRWGGTSECNCPKRGNGSCPCSDSSSPDPNLSKSCDTKITEDKSATTPGDISDKKSKASCVRFADMECNCHQGPSGCECAVGGPKNNEAEKTHCGRCNAPMDRAGAPNYNVTRSGPSRPCTKNSCSFTRNVQSAQCTLGSESLGPCSIHIAESETQVTRGHAGLPSICSACSSQNEKIADSITAAQCDKESRVIKDINTNTISVTQIEINNKIKQAEKTASPITNIANVRAKEGINSMKSNIKEDINYEQEIQNLYNKGQRNEQAEKSVRPKTNIANVRAKEGMKSMKSNIKDDINYEQEIQNLYNKSQRNEQAEKTAKPKIKIANVRAKEGINSMKLNIKDDINYEQEIQNLYNKGHRNEQSQKTARPETKIANVRAKEGIKSMKSNIKDDTNYEQEIQNLDNKRQRNKQAEKTVRPKTNIANVRAMEGIKCKKPNIKDDINYEQEIQSLYNKGQRQIQLRVQGENGLEKNITAEVTRTSSNNYAFDINRFSALGYIALALKETPVVLNKTQSGAFKIKIRQMIARPNAILRKDSAGEMLILPKKAGYIFSEINNNCISNEKLWYVNVKGIGNKSKMQDSPILLLRETSPNNLEPVVDKEFENNYIHGVNNLIEDNAGCYIRVERATSDTYVLDIDSVAPNALLVKSSKGNVKIVRGPTICFEDAGTYGRSAKEGKQQLPIKNKHNNIKKMNFESRVNSNINEIIYNRPSQCKNQCLLDLKAGKLKKTSFKRDTTDKYAIVLDRKLKISLCDHIDNYTSKSNLVFMSIKKNDHGDMLIDFEKGHSFKTGYDSIKITASGNIYVRVNNDFGNLKKTVKVVQMDTRNVSSSVEEVLSFHEINKVRNSKEKVVDTTSYCDKNDESWQQQENESPKSSSEEEVLSFHEINNETNPKELIINTTSNCDTKDYYYQQQENYQPKSSCEEEELSFREIIKVKNPKEQSVNTTISCDTNDYSCQQKENYQQKSSSEEEVLSFHEINNETNPKELIINTTSNCDTKDYYYQQQENYQPKSSSEEEDLSFHEIIKVKNPEEQSVVTTISCDTNDYSCQQQENYQPKSSSEKEDLSIHEIIKAKNPKEQSVNTTISCDTNDDCCDDDQYVFQQQENYSPNRYIKNEGKKMLHASKGQHVQKAQGFQRSQGSAEQVYYQVNTNYEISSKIGTQDKTLRSKVASLLLVLDKISKESKYTNILEQKRNAKVISKKKLLHKGIEMDTTISCDTTDDCCDDDQYVWQQQENRYTKNEGEKMLHATEGVSNHNVISKKLQEIQQSKGSTKQFCYYVDTIYETEVASLLMMLDKISKKSKNKNIPEQKRNAKVMYKEKILHKGMDMIKDYTHNMKFNCSQHKENNKVKMDDSKLFENIKEKQNKSVYFKEDVTFIQDRDRKYNKISKWNPLENLPPQLPPFLCVSYKTL